MKAKVLPLVGKYYGTHVEIIDDHGYKYEINLWNCGSFVPSARELNGVCTESQWVNNEILDGPGELAGLPAKEAFEICDSHFESKETYETALKLVSLINGGQK